MFLANVMVYVDPQQQDEGQIRVAEGIADKFHASMIGVSASAIDPPFVAEGVIIEQTTEDDVRRMRADLAAKGEWFGKITGRERHKLEWRWALESPTAFLAEQARAADLVVFKRRKAQSYNFHYLDSAEAILRMGRPTLSVPEGVTGLSADLERHSVNCQFDVRVHTAEPDAGYLVRLAKSEGADLIVTGGYGHSRLGEWMFGGMTRGLLQQAPICLLMSH
ncbi:universal stress protein [Bradyrhizobium elkanii]|uniref:universal stress protein n=1 Tax=Bradyrhizobium elkanii TaxID=29448 RepID=UPI00101F414B|nr:universal stress protein [Bradyrhizobium elkanii]RYM34446.1 universal stress protein [Bradyrhizobium elkanii]